MVIDRTNVFVEGVDGVTEKEARAYIEYIRVQYPKQDITELRIGPGGEEGEVSLDFTVKPPKFQRIRRITGYLVGTMDRWNNAKQMEEHDRVKHDTSFGKV